jgi:hypothetical protein
MRYTPNAVPNDDTLNDFVGRELNRLANAFKNATFDSVELTGPDGLILPNATYIRWRNNAGVVSPLLGIGLNAANTMVWRNDSQASSMLQIQAMNAANAARNVFQGTALGGAFFVDGTDVFGYDVTSFGRAYIKDPTGGGPYLAFFNSAGTRIGFVQANTATMYVANEVASSDVVLRAANLDLRWSSAGGGIPPTLYLNGKATIHAGDTYLRLNQDVAYTNGVFINSRVRTDTGYFGTNDAQGWNAVISLGGTYGNVQTIGNGTNTWQGYNIANRAVFMNDGGTQIGIYNVTNAQWMILANQNAEVNFYYAGVAAARTQSNNFQVWDGSAWRNIFKGATFRSGQVAVATSGNFAHGFGVTPQVFNVLLQCTTTDRGYAVGDVIDLGSAYAGGGNPSVTADATNISWSMVNTTPFIFNKGATTTGAITAASWRLIATGIVWQ